MRSLATYESDSSAAAQELQVTLGTMAEILLNFIASVVGLFQVLVQLGTQGRRLLDYDTFSVAHLIFLDVASNSLIVMASPLLLLLTSKSYRKEFLRLPTFARRPFQQLGSVPQLIALHCLLYLCFVLTWALVTVLFSLV